MPQEAKSAGSVGKVAIFSDFLDSLGGTEYYNTLLAISLKKRGIDVRVFINEPPTQASWLSILTQHNIPSSIVGAEPDEIVKGPGGRAMAQVKREIEDWRPDVIHSNPPGNLMVGWFMNRTDDSIPLVATDWTTPAHNTAHWYPLDISAHLNKVDAFVATCESVANGIRNFHGYRGPIHTVPHLISEPATALSSVNEIPNSVACVGRLSVEKGQDFLLGAWTQVIEEKPEASLHIYGHGADEKRLRTLAMCLGIQDSVNFGGTFIPYTGIDDISQRHPLFVVPSLFESIPTVLLELMARRKAVVATDVGGVRDLYGDEELISALIVRCADTTSLAARLKELMSNTSLRDKSARKGYEIYKGTYDLERTVNQLMAIYERGR